MKIYYIVIIGAIAALLMVACNAPAIRTVSDEVIIEPYGGDQSAEVPETGEAAQPESELPVLPDLGAAPELHEGAWINSEPLTLAGLRGEVVLLEMWTFGCYNCRNVQPNLIDWHNTYGGEDFRIIANHYPEFNYEADLGNLQQAVVDQGLPYAVLQDNGRETWGNYGTRAWPTLYLIDKWGHIRYTHRGEGHYAETELAIQALVAEDTPPYEAGG